ncbi:ATPase-AAA-core domain-containing protein [Mycena venus]|uniref:ATPase-AAA-core domain-containing protein n=1 Tax=Mycena venus TaxID=2733690 RepID=A0A8H6XEI6_9AGAR|nr:ATPase-AAA-core domain-containing protein [Mycena venus]
MRGAERPCKVRWSHPFLPTVVPLSNKAALETFVAIADDNHNVEDINQLLRLTDNMPLAVNLIAHLVDYEGCPNILARWEAEKTSMLSDGYNKTSNLEVSISLSLSSPRIMTLAGTRDLLNLLSVLPDGLSDVELVQSKLPIPDVLRCRTALLATALGYMDDKHRLKVLSPIREHIQSISPPSPALTHPLQKHFDSLLDLYVKYPGLIEGSDANSQITSNLGNMHQLLLKGLNHDNPNLKDTITGIISLNSFRRINGHGRLILLDHIPALFVEPCDYHLEVKYITEVLKTAQRNVNDNPQGLYIFGDPDQLISRAISHFYNFQDLALECE